MTKFLFWNINKRPLEQLVADLVSEHQVDVLILAECIIPVGRMLETLNPGTTSEFHATYSECEKIQIYTRFSGRFIEPLFESGRFTIRRIRLPLRTEILVAAVHLPSKLYWTDHSQNLECSELARTIREVEENVGHARTLLVGDFNMNPFEEGVFAAAGLHSVMARSVALRGKRTVQGRDYPFFYNPMWGHFGDRIAGPPGTYYYERAEHTTMFWNMFDQVMLRPDLVPLFEDTELLIVDMVGDKSLVSPTGLPDTLIGSDHLPLLFGLNL
ncbi:MAG: endonuclease/exonuclease/phosphatase family protein [Blastocatellia bacterium]